MFKEVYGINEQGFVINVDTADIDEFGNILDENKRYMIPIGYQGFYKAKWNGAEWVEGESEEEKQERESILLLESIYPTPSQIEDAKLEIKSIQIMTELGVLV